MTEEIETTGEVVDVEDIVKRESSPRTIMMTKSTIHQVDVYGGDDISEEKPKTKKQRLEEQYLTYCKSEGFDSVEAWYVSKKWALARRTMLTKEDDIMLKLLNTIASDLGYNDNNKEFVIGTGVKQLSSSRMLNR